VTILGTAELLFDTAPIECTARRLLFSRRHHSQNPGGRPHYGPRYWGYDSTEYAETTQLVFQMPPTMVREEPEKCLIVLSRKQRTGEKIQVEYRCIPKYSGKRVQLMVDATGMPDAVVHICESFMWCENCWAGDRPSQSGRQGVTLSYSCTCPRPVPTRPFLQHPVPSPFFGHPNYRA